MATVPVYESQVQPRGLPGVRQDSVGSPALFASESDGLTNLSKGASDAGTGMMAVAAHMRDREDLTAVLGVEAARKQKMVEFHADMKKNRLGSNADGLVEDTRRWWDEASKEDFEQLKTDRQREVYKQRMSAAALQSMSTASEFQIAQQQVALSQSAKASIVASINSAASNPTASNVALEIDAIRRVNAARAAHEGWAPGKDGKPSVLDVVNGEDITRLHREVLKNLPPELARGYFEKHKDEIDGQHRDEIGKAAMRDTAEAVGQAAATQVIKEHGYEAGVDKLSTALREKFGTDTVTLKAAIASLKEQVGEFEHGATTRVNAAAARVNTLLAKGQPWSVVRQSAEFKDLLDNHGPRGVTLARSIDQHEESLNATRASRAQAESGRAYTEAARRQIDLTRAGQATYLDYLMNPEKIAALTSDQVINLRTVIGDDQTQRIAQMHVQLTKGADALQRAKLDNEAFKALVVGAGMDYKPKPDSDDAKRLITLKENVDMRLYAAAQALGRPLRPEEKQKEAKAAFDDTVRVPGFFSIGGYGATVGGNSAGDIPVSALTTEELAKAVIVVRTPAGKTLGRVRAIDMPPDFVNEAEAQLKRAGMPLSQRNVAEMWLKNSDKWLRARRESIGGR